MGLAKSYGLRKLCRAAPKKCVALLYLFNIDPEKPELIFLNFYSCQEGVRLGNFMLPTFPIMKVYI